jgi:hypothetical protein
MMKARVSKNLKGTMSLPAISKKKFERNDEMEISSDQYWSYEVQNAIKKKYLLILKGEPKALESVEIVKVKPGSLPLPVEKKGDIGKVLRDDTPFRLKASLLKTPEYQTLLRKDLIAIVGKVKKKNATSKEERESVSRAARSETDSVVWDAGAVADAEHEEDEKQMAKGRIRRVAPKKTEKKASRSDDMLLDTSAEDDVEMGNDDVQFLDDETKERIRNHPILGKKKMAQTVNEDIDFVDSDSEAEARRKNHPILGKKAQQKDSHDVTWVDVDDNAEKIKKHPILGKKKNYRL